MVNQISINVRKVKNNILLGRKQFVSILKMKVKNSLN